MLNKHVKLCKEKYSAYREVLNLYEELGELEQCLIKILRHGYFSKDLEKLRDNFNEEIVDSVMLLEVVLQEMCAIDPDSYLKFYNIEFVKSLAISYRITKQSCTCSAQINIVHLLLKMINDSKNRLFKIIEKHMYISTEDLLDFEINLTLETHSQSDLRSSLTALYVVLRLVVDGEFYKMKDTDKSFISQINPADIQKWADIKNERAVGCDKYPVSYDINWVKENWSLIDGQVGNEYIDIETDYTNKLRFFDLDEEDDDGYEEDDDE